jgi:restriction system protein
MKMHENSLFAVLLRSPWWASALIALALIGLVRLFIPDLYAVFAAMPFIVIAVYVGWKQLRAPSAASVAARLERVRTMSWDEFAAAMEKAYGEEGFQVRRIQGEKADFELRHGGRTTLVACKRWKATRTGIEPLRELEAARRAREAGACVYVAAGELTEQALAFAAERNIRLLHGAELAQKIRVAG